MRLQDFEQCFVSYFNVRSKKVYFAVNSTIKVPYDFRFTGWPLKKYFIVNKILF